MSHVPAMVDRRRVDGGIRCRWRVIGGIRISVAVGRIRIGIITVCVARETEAEAKPAVEVIMEAAVKAAAHHSAMPHVLGQRGGHGGYRKYCRQEKRPSEAHRHLPW